MTLDNPLETFTFRCTRNIYDVTNFESFNCDFLSYFIISQLNITKLANEALRSSICFCYMTFVRFVC